MLRIKKLLARAKAADDPVTQLRFAELEIDVPRHSEMIAGSAVVLTATEFKLLELLSRGAVDACRRANASCRTCGATTTRSTAARSTRICGDCAKNLAYTARFLETIRGVGYRFVAEE